MSSSTPDKPSLPQPAPAAQLIRGQRGAVYEVVRELAEGGMAETFVVRRQGIGRSSFVYCLKRMRVGANESDFLHEAYITSLLRHDRIVRAVDADVEQLGERKLGRCFICMELVDGVDLAELLAYYAATDQRIPSMVASYIVEQVLEALDYAHTLSDDEGPLEIVHRDVTPSNLLISRHGYVKLTDFGIARFRARPNYTRTGHVKGKIPYMSPEHFNQQLGIDARTDLYSLGATWFEMLSGGSHPYGSSHDDSSVVGAQYHGRLNPLHELAPDLPPALVELVLWLLRTDKDQRPQSARELLAAVRALPSDPEARTKLAADVAACLSWLEQEDSGAFDDSLDAARVLLDGQQSVFEQDAETREMAIRPATARAWTDAAESAARTSPTTPPGDRPSEPPSGAPRRRRFVAAAALAVALAAAAVATAITFRELDQAGTRAPAAVAPPQAAPMAQAPQDLPNDEHPPAQPQSPSAGERLEPTAAVADSEQALAAAAPSGSERPTARAAAKARTGTLVILVRAPKAAVWVNGDLQPFRRPLELDLPPGRYRIEASEDESVPARVRTSARVTAGKATEITLELPRPF